MLVMLLMLWSGRGRLLLSEGVVWGVEDGVVSVDVLTGAVDGGRIAGVAVGGSDTRSQTLFLYTVKLIDTAARLHALKETIE